MENFLCKDSDNVKDIQNRLNQDLKSIYDWFVPKKLSIYFGDNKAKSVLFA